MRHCYPLAFHAFHPEVSSTAANLRSPALPAASSCQKFPMSQPYGVFRGGHLHVRPNYFVHKNEARTLSCGLICGDSPRSPSLPRCLVTSDMPTPSSAATATAPSRAADAVGVLACCLERPCCRLSRWRGRLRRDLVPVINVFWSGRMLRGESATSRDLVRRHRASPMRFGDTLVSPEPLGRGGRGVRGTRRRRRSAEEGHVEEVWKLRSTIKYSTRSSTI